MHEKQASNLRITRNSDKSIVDCYQSKEKKSRGVHRIISTDYHESLKGLIAKGLIANICVTSKNIRIRLHAS